MSQNLLLHSMSEFSSITLPILELIKAKVVCEIGSEHGGNSVLLYEWLEANDGKLISIDPNPNKDFEEWASSVKNVVTHIPKISLDVISELPEIDAWFIDGDHNWFTVYNELTSIYALSKKRNKPMVVFLHYVGWPWARRDCYEDISRIPAHYLQPHSWELGIHLGSNELKPGGLKSYGKYANAMHEGGRRNGVLAAIEDFAHGLSEEFYWANIPAIFGLGVLIHRGHAQSKEIATLLQPFHDNLLLKKLEDNRLANYLKVLECQDREAELAAIHINANEHQNSVNYLVNILSDEDNHPEIWDIFKSSLDLPNQGNLTELTNYMNTLLSVPQDKTVMKVLRVSTAVGIAYLGNPLISQQLLQEMSIKESECRLIAGALLRVNEMVHREHLVTA